MNIGKTSEAPLVLGAIPRADLLPPAVGLALKAKARRRSLGVMLVAVLVVTGAGCGAAAFHAAQSQSELAAESQRTVVLLAQQSKYAGVRKINTAIKNGTAARQVGSSTSIDWQSYLASIAASLPADTSVTTFTAKSGSPVVAFTQPTLPLQGERMAELNFVATSPSLPDVQAWLDALAKLKGFVDALPGTVTLAGDTGTYQVGITMHINELALDGKYSSAANKKAAKDAAAATTGDPTAATADAAGSASDSNTDTTSTDENGGK